MLSIDDAVMAEASQGSRNCGCVVLGTGRAARVSFFMLGEWFALRSPPAPCLPACRRFSFVSRSLVHQKLALLLSIYYLPTYIHKTAVVNHDDGAPKLLVSGNFIYRMYEK